MVRRKAAVASVVALLAIIAFWVTRSRQRPSAFPFAQRVLLALPRPFLSRRKVCEALAPAPGERVLEVGPGTGYYTLEIARQLEPGGRLDALDIQQPMLEELMRRATAAGISTIVPTRGDAETLPFPDATFDAALLVATLGEIPRRERALGELRRVLKPGGRLVVGEGQPDPHMVAADVLCRGAERVGLRCARVIGGRLGYLARMRPRELLLGSSRSRMRQN